jgi:phosphomannomutase
MNTPLFGTSGVRGVVNRDLTPELCQRIGQALGAILPPQSAVCLATDSRLSRELIKGAVTDGLIDSDINVALLDVVPTPALALLTREMGFDAGVMITASHNPPEFNGIKLFNRDSIGFSRAQEEEVEEVYYSNRFRTGKKGAVESVPRMKERYFDLLQSRVSSWTFNRNLKLIVDPGNGAASGFASELFKRLQLKAIPFNDVPDGRFPGRSPEPKEDTLQGTIKYLKQKDGDLAVCFDGDADRVVFCDQKGFLGFNEMAAFISRKAIERSGKNTVATTVETGILLDLAVRDLGGRVIRGKVGDVYAAHLASENDAALGVESVGVYILPEMGYYPESIFATLLLLSSITNVSEIRQFIASMPPVFFSKDKVHCPNELKATAMSKIKEAVPALKPSAVNDLDGLRLEYEDAWMLIRASGTEPGIRVLAESMSKSYTSRLLGGGISIAREAVKGAKP